MSNTDLAKVDTKSKKKIGIWGTIILTVIVYLIAGNSGKWFENATNPTYNKENYALLENNKLSSQVLGFELIFPSNWDVMSDLTYNSEYYDSLSKDRRIPKIDTSNEFIKGFVAFDKNSKDYISFGFMRVELGYDANKAVGEIADSLKKLSYYKKVEVPNKTVVDNKVFYTIYSEVNQGQYNNKQRWYIYQSGRMIIQIVAVSHENIENVDKIIKEINMQ